MKIFNFLLLLLVVIGGYPATYAFGQQSSLTFIPVEATSEPSQRSGWQTIAVDYAIGNPTGQWRGLGLYSYYSQRFNEYTGQYFSSAESRQQGVTWDHDFPSRVEVLLPPGFVVYASRDPVERGRLQGDIPLNMTDLEVTLSPYWEWTAPDFAALQVNDQPPISLDQNHLTAKSEINFPLLAPLTYDILHVGDTVEVPTQQITVSFSNASRYGEHLAFDLSLTNQNLLGDREMHVYGWIAGSDGVVRTWNTDRCLYDQLTVVGPGQTLVCHVEIGDVSRDLDNFYTWFVMSSNYSEYQPLPPTGVLFMNVLDLSQLQADLPEVIIENCTPDVGQYVCTIRNTTDHPIDLSTWAMFGANSPLETSLGIDLYGTRTALLRPLQAGERWEFPVQGDMPIQLWKDMAGLGGSYGEQVDRFGEAMAQDGSPVQSEPQPSAPIEAPTQTMVFVPPISLTPQSGPTTAAASGPVATFNQGANVRRGPGANFDPPIGSFTTGQTADILGRNLAGDWYKVRYNNSEGWVLASLVTVSGDMSNLPIDPGPPTPVP